MNLNAAIVRYGEISLKGRNRRDFELRLVADIENYLRLGGHDRGRVILRKGRIYIHDLTSRPALEKVLGVHSYSLARRVEKSREALEAEAAAAAEVVRGATSFCVRCQRVDKQFSLNSMDVERLMGEVIRRITGIGVDLVSPQVTLFVEIGQDGAYLFRDKIPGFGGFPFGTAGRLVSLVSSGIDSPVATFLMMKRGVEPILVHYRISDSDYRKVLALKAKLEEYTAGRTLEIHTIDRDEVFRGRFDGLYANRRFHAYMCVLCKYLMHKKAGEIARERDALGIVTGDNLAQVASQTLKNLAVYHTVSGLPVYSPLIAFEKEQTIHLARAIGTYDLSVAHSQGCRPPATPKTGVSTDAFARILRDSGVED